MYLVDMRSNTIHDLSCPRYECQIQRIPTEQTKKVYTLDTVKRMCDMNAMPRYQGCQFCMPDYYVFDMGKVY
jgi:hypothetical protein